MKHPAREEWIAYLYGETTPAGKSELREHLQACADCREALHGYKQTARALDQWKVPARGRRSSTLRPMLQWAAAASILFAIGIALGRSSNQAAMDKLRVEMRQIALETAATSNAEAVHALKELSDATQARFEAVQEEHAADYATLRKELETVAVLTDESFRRAQQQIVQLAEYTQPNSAAKQP